MFTSSDSDQHWKKYGEIDPYFAVTAFEEHHRDQLDEATLQDFFLSGRRQFADILSTIHTHIDPTFRPGRALDFGCGVGRLLLPLACVAEAVVALDISEAMLAEARRHCEAQGLHNVEFTLSDDRLSRLDGRFDFILSFIVFQHIPTPRGEQILERLLELLADGGVAVLHFTYESLSPRSSRLAHWIFRHVPLAGNLYNLFIGRGFSYPQMQSNFYDLDRIFLMLQNTGCSHAYTRFTLHKRNYGVMIYAQKRLSQPGS